MAAAAGQSRKCACARRASVPQLRGFGELHFPEAPACGSRLGGRCATPGELRWVLEIVNPVYSPGFSGVSYANAKGSAYPTGFPIGYAATAPKQLHFRHTSGTVPPYSSSPDPYQTAVDPKQSAYPQQSPNAQQVMCYTQRRRVPPAPVMHHTKGLQPNCTQETVYAAPIPPPRSMGMVAGATMAVSTGTLLTIHSPISATPHAVTVPTYRSPDYEFQRAVEKLRQSQGDAVTTKSAESEGGSGRESRGRCCRRCRRRQHREGHRGKAGAVRSPEELVALPSADSPPSSLRAADSSRASLWPSA
ncbi:myelin-associated neurite-outgrowth inhibitor-like [Meles meles]|uniref:myelin-associated neurite-outgrowth inhibitor-like n=1 Tax=Meles meles TaxID=9662 RepID=UPI001E69F31D|nr:myelin-associated neurite-outgrowth inhibitor-like [Meles meles]